MRPPQGLPRVALCEASVLVTDRRRAYTLGVSGLERSGRPINDSTVAVGDDLAWVAADFASLLRSAQADKLDAPKCRNLLDQQTAAVPHAPGSAHHTNGHCGYGWLLPPPTRSV